MTEHTSPSETPLPQGSGFFSWIRGLGITRNDNRWLSGVAAGIATRFKIDPIIVRGIFVALALLGGPGIVLYLAFWLLLPNSKGVIEIEELFAGRARTSIVFSVIALGICVIIPALFWTMRSLFSGDSPPLLFGPDWVIGSLGFFWWSAVAAVVVWGCIWLTKQPEKRKSTSDAPHATTTQGESAQAASAQQGSTDSATDNPGADANSSPVSSATATATATEPEPSEGLGIDPKLGDPDQLAPKPGTVAWAEKISHDAAAWGENVSSKALKLTESYDSRSQLKQSIGVVQGTFTIAFVMLAAGVAALWSFLSDFQPLEPLAAGIIAAVSVCAISMIIAGARGRSSGWVSTLAALGTVALVISTLSSAVLNETRVVPLGDAYVTPTASNQAVFVLAGNTTVDLTELSPGAADQEIEVWMLFGNTDIIANRATGATVTSAIFAGGIERNGEKESSGVLIHESFLVPNNTSRLTPESTRQTQVKVTIRTLFGNTEIFEQLPGTETGSQIQEIEQNLEHELRRLQQLKQSMTEQN